MSEFNEYDREVIIFELKTATGWSPVFFEARTDEELIQLHKDRVLQRG
ncbi:hypothetical protein [Rossellomorea marisflavi]